MSLPVDNIYDSIVREQNISDGGYVQMEWSDSDNTSLPVGSVCPVDDRYILFSEYYPSQSAVNNYRYSVKYLHRLAQTAYLPFYFKTQAVGEDGGYEDIILATYPYTGPIGTIADALAECLTDHGDLGSWTAEVSGLSGSTIASINFDGATIKSAAQAIADAYGTDYAFDWERHVIRFGTLGTGGESPVYGTVTTQDNGTENAGTLVSATDGGIQYNTFRILGGTRNMSKKTIRGRNVQVTQRLMLDENDSIIGGGTPKIMKDLVFDDIYPKMELWIYDVHERRCWLTDENGKKIVDHMEEDPITGEEIPVYKQYSKWYFRLAYWNGTQLVPYTLDTSLIIEGLPLSMVFQPNYEEGALPQPLVGREFELVYFSGPNPPAEHEADDVIDGGYQPSQGEFRIVFRLEGATILPSTSEEALVPCGGSMSLLNNKVTLTNVAMDDIYVQAAKAELAAAGQQAAAAYASQKGSFTYLTFGTAPSIGGNITMVRENLITHEVQYTVGNHRDSKGLIGRMSDKIEAANVGAGRATTGSGDSVRNGGVSESSIPLLSQMMGSGSVVKDSLTILRQLILGTTGHGIFIDAHGDASMTIGSLTVLGTTHLNEIDINHIKHTGGMMLVTRANIIVDHVEHLEGGLDKLYFRRVDGSGQSVYNQFVVGDLAIMMVFNEALDGSINRYFWREVSDIDDGTGEFGYITLLPSSAYHSQPREGDVVIQLGNTSVASRQGCTVLGGSGPNGGFFAVYDGFTTWRESAPSLDDYDTAITYISPKKNKINGNFISVNGVSVKDRLDALQASLLSVSQQSDQQLVIWYGDDDAPLPNSGNLTHWNNPAQEWHDADTAAGNTEQQELHLEDVYYLRRNNTTRTGGRAWQWTYDTALAKFLWVEITDADTIAALEAADDAVATANEAKTLVENFGDDGIISAGTEKSELLIRWQDTVAEYLKYIEQAQDYGLDDQTAPSGQRTTYQDYVYRYSLVAKMLNGGTDPSDNILSGVTAPAWLTSLNVDTVLSEDNLTASDYRTTWKDYFNSRATLLKGIEAAAKSATDAAQADATNALSKIGAMASDAKLDPSEKLTVKREFLSVWRERAEILDRCKEGNVYVNNTIEQAYVNPYLNAFQDLADYLNGGTTWYTNPSTGNVSNPEYSATNAANKIPSWLHSSHMDDTEDIVGTTWQNTWSAFYAARTALLTALSEDAKDKANSAKTAADGAQQTANAKKRIFKTAANTLPPVPYDAGDLWADAIWYTTSGGVRTYLWTGNTLICTTSKSASQQASINDWADANSGVSAKLVNLGDQIEAEVADRKNNTKSGLHIDARTGSLYVESYDSQTDSWSRLATISLALQKNNNGNFTGKLSLTADNAEMSANLISVIASNITIRADHLSFVGDNDSTLKIAAGNIDFTGNNFTIGADRINFEGKTVTIAAGKSLTFIGGTASGKQQGTIDLTGARVTMNGSDISFSATNSFKTAVGNSGVVLRTDLISAFLEDVITANGQPLSDRLGLVISKGYAANNFGFGYYTYNSNTEQYDWNGGLNFEISVENNVRKTRLTLSADNARINADTLMLDGRTVNISATKEFTISSAGKLSLSGGNIEIKGSAVVTVKSGSTLNLTAATVNLNAGQLTYAGESIDLTAATVSLDADQITFEGKTVTIAAGKSLTFTGGTASGKQKGTISFTGARILMNAEQINFKSGNFVINNGTENTFEVSSAGNITFKGELNGATGTFSGSLTSNDNKVLLTSTGVEGWGLSYTWRGFAVSNNGFTNGDLATIGARLDANGYDYGRIALVKRLAGTYSANNAEVNIVLSAYDGSIECTKITADRVIVSNVQLSNGILLNSVVGNSLNDFTPSGANVINIYNGNRVLVRGTGGSVFLPDLSDCRSCLGISSSSTSFALDLIVVAAAGSSFRVYGYMSSQTSDYPHIRNNDSYQDMTGGIAMAEGDILHLLLTWDGTDYIAFIISHRD